jgi:hypothetical protein
MPLKDPQARQEYNKQYRQDHKQEIDDKRGISVECVCGHNYILKHKTRHEKTAFHIKRLPQN